MRLQALVGMKVLLDFTDQGNDIATPETLRGVTSEVNYWDGLHNQMKAQSPIIWAYLWHKWHVSWNRRLSLKLDIQLILGEGDECDGILIYQALKKSERYQKGEKVEKCFRLYRSRRLAWLTISL
jgi:hypothetical protein